MVKLLYSLLGKCFTGTLVVVIVPTFPFVEVKLSFFQTEHSTLIFPSDFQNSWESRYLGKETHKICAISDHKLKLPQIPIVGAVAMRLKKVAVTCGNCNYCGATSSQ